MTHDASTYPKTKRKPGALADLQRRFLVGLCLLALSWFWFFWPDKPALALAGVLLCMVGYTVVQAVELLAMHWVNRRDPVPSASFRELVLAWASESLVAAHVFGWRQPFRPNAVPDNVHGAELHGQRGVVFIHGLVCNRGFWTPWLKRLQGTRHAFVAVNLEPVFGSISAYAPLIDAAVKAVTQASGMPPILVCHSMGGLAARAWLAARDRADDEALPVHRLVTIGSPHHGTWLARFGRNANAVEMREGSDWLARLNGAGDTGSQGASPLICWFSNCDHIVFPASNATLKGADNRLVRGAGHVQLAFVPQVMDETLSLLEAAPTQSSALPTRNFTF